MKSINLLPTEQTDQLFYSFIISIILYVLVFHYIYTEITKTTLKYFTDRWEYYKPSIWLVGIYFLTIFLIDITWFIEKSSENSSIDQIFTYLSKNFYILYVMIYIFSSTDLIIANYRIDKKLIAEYEKKFRELQEFTAKISHYRRIKV